MLTYLRNILLSVLSHVLPNRALARLFRWWHGRHFNDLDGSVSDKTLEGLLTAMELGFRFVPHWGERIRGFSGTLVFAARSASDPRRKPVQATAIFDGGRMTVLHEAADSCDARVTFSSPEALFSFIMSRSHDIVEALLTNSVETEGNLNYVYRFGFLVTEMTRWMRISA